MWYDLSDLPLLRARYNAPLYRTPPIFRAHFRIYACLKCPWRGPFLLQLSARASYLQNPGNPRNSQLVCMHVWPGISVMPWSSHGHTAAACRQDLDAIGWWTGSNTLEYSVWMRSCVVVSSYPVVSVVCAVYKCRIGLARVAFLFGTEALPLPLSFFSFFSLFLSSFSSSSSLQLCQLPVCHSLTRVLSTPPFVSCHPRQAEYILKT